MAKYGQEAMNNSRYNCRNVVYLTKGKWHSQSNELIERLTCMHTSLSYNKSFSYDMCIYNVNEHVHTTVKKKFYH